MLIQCLAGSQFASMMYLAVPKFPKLFSYISLLRFSLLMFLNFAALYRLLFLPLSPLAASSPPPQLLKSPLRCVTFVSSALIICELKAEHTGGRRNDPEPSLSFQVDGSSLPIKGGTQESLLFASSILFVAAFSLFLAGHIPQAL